MSTTHFNKLTPAEAERLAILAEECGEVVQIIGKILRHGFDSWSPLDQARTTNRESLEREIGDLEAIRDRMVIAKDIDPNAIIEASHRKQAKLPNWTHHQLDSRLSPEPQP